MLSIAALLSIDQLFNRPRTKGHHMLLDEVKRQFVVLEGDLLTQLNIFNSFVLNNCNQSWCHDNLINYESMKKALRIRKQLRSYLKLLRLPVLSSQGESIPLLKSIIAGFL
eukprot:UN00887